LIGFAQYAHGESRCGLSDAGRFHEAVTRPVEEASPAYFLRIAETFIDDCPDRLEIREAHLVAARAGKLEALDIDLVDRGQFAAIEVGQLRDRPVRCAAIEIGRQLDAVHRVDQRAIL